MNDFGGGDRLIFIAGAPRSGTTLVQNMVDCHPQIYAGPEFGRIPNIIALRRALAGSVKRGRIDDFCNLSDIDEAIGSLIERLLLPAAERNRCRYMCEKTPWNILAFPDLLSILPKARFVHVVRDPRAVVASMLEVGRRSDRLNLPAPDFTRDIGLAVRYVETCFNIGARIQQEEPNRVYVLKFEDWVSDPEVQSRKLCGFIGVDWDQSMLYPADQDHAAEKSLSGNWYSKEDYRRNPDNSDLEKWRRSLRPTQVALIDGVFRKHVAVISQGYCFDLNHLSVYSRIVAASRLWWIRKRTGCRNLPLRILGGHGSRVE